MSLLFSLKQAVTKKNKKVARVTYVNIIMHYAYFQILKCTLTISRFTIPMDSMHTSLTFQTTLWETSLK